MQISVPTFSEIRVIDIGQVKKKNKREHVFSVQFITLRDANLFCRSVNDFR